MPRNAFTPRTRAEALGGTLTDIRQAAAEDPAFLAALAQIVADLLAQPAATDTQPAADPARRAWQQAQQQVATRETRIHV